MTTLDLLKAARARISDPAHYTARDGAETAAGRPCAVDDPAAARWSAAAALAAATGLQTSLAEWDRAIQGAYGALAPPGPARSPQARLVAYGARHSHAEVLALYDAAIARLETP